MPNNMNALDTNYQGAGEVAQPLRCLLERSKIVNFVCYVYFNTKYYLYVIATVTENLGE